MYCYVLQGVLGVLALAAIIAGTFGGVWCFITGIEKIEFGCDHIAEKIHPSIRKVANYILIGALVIGISIGLAILCWALGGDLIKRFFHFCIG